jgi:hypothetical protein
LLYRPGCATRAGAEAGDHRLRAVPDYGLYQRGPTSNETPPTATQFGAASADFKHVRTTRKVPARFEQGFGFRYRIVGPPAGEVLQVLQVTLLPPPGAKSPVGKTPFTRTIVPQFDYAGIESGWLFTFDYLWEMVPGIWTVQVWSGNQKLTEQLFEVYLSPTS